MRRRSPVFGALINKHIWFGIERTWWAVALLVVTFSVMILRQAGFGVLALIPLAIGHLITSFDSDQHKLYMKYKNKGFIYRAWSSQNSYVNKRPIGYGRRG